MKTSWRTAWQGQDIVVYRDEMEVDRLVSFDLRFLCLVSISLMVVVNSSGEVGSSSTRLNCPRTHNPCAAICFAVDAPNLICL